MSDLPAGWYKDPADPSTQRYWDGEGWLGEAIPADAVPPDGPPPTEPPPAPASPAPSPAAAPPAEGATAGTPAPQAWGPPAAGPPQSWTPPPGWMPPPGWAPPPGWVPPPGWTPQTGWTPQAGAPMAGAPMAYGYQPQIRPHGLALAGMGPRLAARLFDIFFMLLLTAAVNGWFAYQWVLEFAPIYRAAMEDPFGDRQQGTPRMTYLLWTMLLLTTLLWLAYEVPAIGGSGQTLGKRIMHIKVVRVENTEPIGFARAFRRWGRLGLWTPLWGCLGIGFLFQFIDSVSPLFDQKMRQALHDKTAGTVVVDAPPRPRQSAETVQNGGGSTDDPTGGTR